MLSYTDNLSTTKFNSRKGSYWSAYRFETDKKLDDLKVELFEIRENKQSVLERFRVKGGDFLTKKIEKLFQRVFANSELVKIDLITTPNRYYRKWEFYQTLYAKLN